MERTTFASMTFPSGPIVASIVTAPATRADCAIAGYTGLTSLIFFGALMLPPIRTGATLAFALAAAASAFFLAATASAFSLPAAASAAALAPAAFAATASSLLLSYDLNHLPSDRTSVLY